MSLDIRYVTNGHKAVYVVRESSQTPTFVGFYETMDKIDERIRHYAPKGEPEFYGPDSAWFAERLNGMNGLVDYLYPNHPNCADPKHAHKKCVAESCRYSVTQGELESEQEVDWLDVGGTPPKWCRWVAPQ